MLFNINTTVTECIIKLYIILHCLHHWSDFLKNPIETFICLHNSRFMLPHQSLHYVSSLSSVTVIWIFTLVPVQTCITPPQLLCLSHGYCSNVRHVGQLGLPHNSQHVSLFHSRGYIHSFFLCVLNHYYKLEMCRMCEFEKGGWWYVGLHACADSEMRQSW